MRLQTSCALALGLVLLVVSFAMCTILFDIVPVLSSDFFVSLSSTHCNFRPEFHIILWLFLLYTQTVLLGIPGCRPLLLLSPRY